MKRVLPPFPALLLAGPLAAAGLEVANGDFSDLGGMTPGRRMPGKLAERLHQETPH